MSPTKIDLVYILGAGRSGTTILAALLGHMPGMHWRGELIQLAHWQSAKTQCSCGEALRDCPYWTEQRIADATGPLMEYCHPFEQHRSVFRNTLLNSNLPSRYSKEQRRLLEQLCTGSEILLDSSKYVGRATALAQCRNIETRYIYLVRDARGVVYSFRKNVQTRRKLLSACLYYCSINALAEFACRFRLKDRYIRIRYEDLVENPERTLRRLGDFLALDPSSVTGALRDNGRFSASHIAGGNRWLQQGPEKLTADVEWQQKLPRVQQWIVFLLCLPFQLINRYRP